MVRRGEDGLEIEIGRYLRGEVYRRVILDGVIDGNTKKIGYSEGEEVYDVYRSR